MRATPQSGFTLVELAVVVLITGVLMGGTFSLMKPYLESAQRTATQTRMDNIAQALALYVKNYHRLPCPARADLAATNVLYGTPRNSGASGIITTNNCGSTTDADHIGILPFKALGLNEDQAKDGYGNLLTYAVSPALARPTTTATSVHSQCRMKDIWVDSTTNKNINAEKANFCCAQRVGNDILINNNGNPVFAGAHDATGSNYGLVNASETTAPTGFNTRFIAFALISHGENGDYAYMPNSGTLKPVTNQPNSASETTNNADDLTFESRPNATARGADYFDDIVLWRMNDQVISAFGDENCGRP